MFAVIRHPEIAVPGTTSESAWPIWRARGFVRVSEWRAEPAEFELEEYVDAPDLDASPAPAAKPAKSAAKAVKEEE